MKALFASADYGISALVFFVIIFAGIALWAYWPKNRENLESMKNIPLQDEDHHERA